MTDGVYDIDGKCVNCGQYHPCNCEINDITHEIDEMEQEQRIDRYIEEQEKNLDKMQDEDDR